ncbi:MAG: hypothetical protein ACXV5N_07920 [Halobacteriota archaeon]
MTINMGATTIFITFFNIIVDQGVVRFVAAKGIDKNERCDVGTETLVRIDSK